SRQESSTGESEEKGEVSDQPKLACGCDSHSETVEWGSLPDKNYELCSKTQAEIERKARAYDSVRSAAYAASGALAGLVKPDSFADVCRKKLDAALAAAEPKEPKHD